MTCATNKMSRILVVIKSPCSNQGCYDVPAHSLHDGTVLASTKSSCLVAQPGTAKFRFVP